MNTPPVDLCVVGAGPAGMTCAMQAARSGLSVYLFDPEPPGGLVRGAWRIDNLPDFPGGIGGVALAEKWGSDLHHPRLTVFREKVGACQYQTESGFTVITDGQRFYSRSLVLATGTKPRPFSINGWEKARQYGNAHRDIRTVPAGLQGRRIVVVGGGEVELDSALSLHARGGKVWIAVRKSGVRVSGPLLSEVLSRGIPLHYQCALRSLIVSDGRLQLMWQQAVEGLPAQADHLLACIGREPQLELLDGLPATRIAPDRTTTDLPGLFLAGDNIRHNRRFITTAVQDGLSVARAVQDFLSGRKERQ